VKADVLIDEQCADWTVHFYIFWSAGASSFSAVLLRIHSHHVEVLSRRVCHSGRLRQSSHSYANLATQEGSMAFPGMQSPNWLLYYRLVLRAPVGYASRSCTF